MGFAPTHVPHWVVVLVSVFLGACSGTDFRGESAKSSKKDQAQTNGGDSDASDAGGTGVDVADSGAGDSDAGSDVVETGDELGDDDEAFDDISTTTGTVKCLDVEDPAATDELGSRTDIRNAGRLAINQFVNEVCQRDPVNPQITSSAGVVGTPETAETICRVRGFKSVEESLSDSFSSPSDNQIASWNQTSKAFEVISATTNNVWFGFIKCKEKLKDKCVKDIKVKCQG